jgi:hypothetical protein
MGGLGSEVNKMNHNFFLYILSWNESDTFTIKLDLLLKSHAHVAVSRDVFREVAYESSPGTRAIIETFDDEI